mmetsp:Transcript_32915/g.79624  ORF Transcript_32915/g.79624 Transcript_32915/m.79624 type:complete len:218 (+) Transcript_32915:368-1021(+)
MVVEFDCWELIPPSSRKNNHLLKKPKNTPILDAINSNYLYTPNQEVKPLIITVEPWLTFLSKVGTSTCASMKASWKQVLLDITLPRMLTCTTSRRYVKHKTMLWQPREDYGVPLKTIMSVALATVRLTTNHPVSTSQERIHNLSWHRRASPRVCIHAVHVMSRMYYTNKYFVMYQALAIPLSWIYSYCHISFLLAISNDSFASHSPPRILLQDLFFL